MRELLYIHASTSYLASHLFNTQQAYFTYDDREDEYDVLVDHDVSFRQGLTAGGSTTYCPRLLLFDYKNQFGSLSHINALYTGEEDLTARTWTGSVIKHRQEPIPQSMYHARLDAGEDEDENDENLKGKDTDKPVQDLTPSIRFWSDFSRVFYHPRGLHRVPNPLEWEREIGWATGSERFISYDAEHSVMEDSFRLFAEECDLLQGVQLSLDAPSFGSFTLSFLTQLRDEYPKLPILSFCSLSPRDPATIDLDDTPGCIATLNDALTLHELASLSTITVPLQHPTTWRRGLWSEHLKVNFSNPYHSSAILAAHVESATLPLRLKPSVPSSTDLATLCAQLNWRGDTPFAALSGAFPMPSSPSGLEKFTYDFSHPVSLHGGKSAIPFAQRDVFRGLDTRGKEDVQKWVEETQLLREPLLSTSYIDLPYPIPSSYPQFFTRLGITGQPQDIISPAQAHIRVRTLPMYTSLLTTPRTGDLARSYARFVENVFRRRVGVLGDLGVETEVVKEVREGFWGWVGAYDDGQRKGDEDEDDGERGEDERDIA